MVTVAALMSVMAAVEAEIRLRGIPGTAIIEEVGPGQRTKQGMRYPATLRLDGVTAKAERDLLVTATWDGPPARPRPGERVEVLLVPDDPPRLVPVAALGALWETLAGLVAAWTIAVAAAWATTRPAWRDSRRGL
jgi:hypothetical protein